MTGTGSHVTRTGSNVNLKLCGPEPEVTGTGSTVHRKSRCPEVTWTRNHVTGTGSHVTGIGSHVTGTGNHMDKKSRIPKLLEPEVIETGSNRKPKRPESDMTGEPEVTGTGCHQTGSDQNRKSHGPEGNVTGCHETGSDQNRKLSKPSQQHC